MRQRGETGRGSKVARSPGKVGAGPRGTGRERQGKKGRLAGRGVEQKWI
jgi:hypothetical protein